MLNNPCFRLFLPALLLTAGCASTTRLDAPGPNDAALYKITASSTSRQVSAQAVANAQAYCVAENKHYLFVKHRYKRKSSLGIDWFSYDLYFTCVEADDPRLTAPGRLRKPEPAKPRPSAVPPAVQPPAVDTMPPPTPTILAPPTPEPIPPAPSSPAPPAPASATVPFATPAAKGNTPGDPESLDTMGVGPVIRVIPGSYDHKIMEEELGK